MFSINCWIIIVLSLYKDVLGGDVCAAIRNVTGAEEGDVILHVDQTGIDEINWINVNSDTTIARTGLGGFIKVLVDRYRGRTNSADDGSLIIRTLTREDQGIYKADITYKEGRGMCDKVTFDLKVHDVQGGDVCAAVRNVTGAEGGEVILHVNQTGIDEISWINLNSNTVIARTLPGGFIRVLVDRYRGRTNSADDGSLIIHTLTREDEGIYKADIAYKERKEKCGKVTFDLKVHNVLGEDVCAAVRNVTGAEGGDIILHVNQTGMDEISWINSNTVIARTEPEGFIRVRGDRYRGRTNSADDGSLIIRTLTREDQGIYRADIAYKEGRGTCDTVTFDLKVHNRKRKVEHNYTVQNIIRLALSSCVIIIGSCVFFHHMKREDLSPSRDSR